MAALDVYIYNKTGQQLLGQITANNSTTIGTLLSYPICVSNGITELSDSVGGQALNHDIYVIPYGYSNLYDVTPEPETVTGFFLDGQEYKIGGDIAWGNISGTLSDQTDLNTALSGKQNTLTTQTAYTSKGTSTKVPTITTNTLGQVTGITETSISFPVTSVGGSTGAVGLKTINGNSIVGTGDITVSSSTTITVTLTSAGWSSNSQTVSATGVTASNTVIVSPSPDDIADYADCGVYCSAQASGTLTFGCDTAPSGDIVVNVLIMS